MAYMLGSFAAFSIFALTVGVALSRPRFGAIRLGHAEAAIGGAFLVLLTGIVTPAQAVAAVEALALPVITIVSLMAVTLIAESAGMLRLVAHQVAIAAGGDARRLFLYLFTFGALMGTIFTNDAAVLILTPLVFGLIEDIQEKNWTFHNKLPFYFAVLYVGNLVGAFVISNPINLVVSSVVGIGFVEYAAWMVLPALVSMLVSFFGLLWFFRGTLPRTCRIPERGSRPSVDKAVVRGCAILLCFTLLGFFGGGAIGLSVWLVAVMSATALSALFWVRGNSLAPIVRGIGWDVIVFVVGIFIIVIGLRNQGFTQVVGEAIELIGGATLSGLMVATGFGAAICSALFNNHPTAGLMLWVVDRIAQTPVETNLLIYAALIGGDLGPKMLPIGSLAALMWFRILRARGVDVPYAQYIRIGIPVTLAAVAASLTVLIVEWMVYQRFAS